VTVVEQQALEFPYFYKHLRLLPDGRAVWIQRKMFTHAITVGRADNGGTFDTHWCYESEAQALAALEKWNPFEQEEPEGWFRHVDTGRRRPGGDPAKQYIGP
jgi:hypothetical protein